MINDNNSINFQKYVITPLIGQGSFGKVYAISDKHVAKRIYRLPIIPWPSLEMQIDRLFKEYLVAETLHQEGISVPEPEGIFPVTVRVVNNAFNLLGKKSWCFIMEKVDGIVGSKAPSRLVERIQELQKLELTKAAEAGFTAGYDAYGLPNVIYNPEKDKVVLIDFSYWKSRH